MNFDVELELIRTIVTAGILFYLLRIGQREQFKTQHGWKLIIIGFSLTLFASILDISDNFPYLNKFVVLGETETEAFLEKFVGYLGGLTFLFIGFIKWFPLIGNLKKVDAELRVAAVAFESREGILITDASNIILRANKAFVQISGYSSEEIVGKHTRMFNSGRQSKDFYSVMWDSIVRTGGWQGEIWNLRKNGEAYLENLTITSVKNQDGLVTNYVAVVTDITLSKSAEEKIWNLAFYDSLTQLPNRALLIDRLRQALVSSARNGKRGALLFIDLDNFKTLNDTLGHDAGDLLLQQVAQRIVSCVREGDTVARLGGDEFVVVLEGFSEEILEAASQAELVGNKVLASMTIPHRFGSYEYRGTASIGAALFNDHDFELDELMKQADIAMYQAKKSGRNTLKFFDPEMQYAINERASLEAELRAATEANAFQLHYQIQVDSSNHPRGAEALIRWTHPQRGVVSPARFIPLAEETGLILPIGEWVLKAACAQLSQWSQHANTRNLLLAVNVSAKQFLQPTFVNQVQEILLESGANPARLKIELTESMMLENIDSIISKMHELKTFGIRFSMDDFGTGYSSLQYINRLPMNQLKIDQSFIRDITAETHDAPIVETIIAMGKSLGLNVIAEGVETTIQRDFLNKHGCHTYQGYLFSKPLPIEEFEALLMQHCATAS